MTHNKIVDPKLVAMAELIMKPDIYKNWGVNAIMIAWFHIIYQYFCYLQKLFTNYPSLIQKQQWKQE